MVIVITGIIAAMVASFIRRPVESYFDTARRAELTDVADTAVRRISRDLRLSLPNSVRNPVDDSGQCIEFIPTKIGGRYRAAAEAAGGNALDFTIIDGSFDMLWLNTALPTASQIAVGDVVVVYNDGGTSGDAYSGNNAIQVSGLAPSAAIANSTTVTFVGAGVALPFDGKKLPSESPTNRFQVIPGATHVVSYGCNGGVLTRSTRVLTAAWAKPANCAAMAAGAAPAILAQNVTACSLRYEQPGASTGLSRFGIVSISLEMTQPGSNESVRLYSQAHLDNTP